MLRQQLMYMYTKKQEASLLHMKAVLWTAIGEGELCICTLSVSACYTA